MFKTPPRSMVSTRSMKKEELIRQAQDGNNGHVREECVEHRISEKVVEPKEIRNEMDNTPGPSTARVVLKTGSKKMSTTSSTTARRKRLELEAAEAKARIQFELIEKKLAADIADLEDEGCESASDELPTNNEKVNERIVNEWLDKSIPEVKTQQVTYREHDIGLLAPTQPQSSALQDKRVSCQSPSAVGIAPNARSSPAALAGDGTDGTVHALASALKDLAAASASGTKGYNNRMLSRLSINKDLPTYSGDPLEWLQFKQAYEESTEVCTFSERENVWRLRKCLKGPAKDAVISLLIGATSPDIIISTLELQFGNPDVIVSRILLDLNKLRPMSPEYHRDIVPFAIKVKNCVAAVTSIGCEDYLKGMNLVSAILSKLPTVLISKWSDYSFPLIKDGSKPKLVIMSEFLNEEAVKITNTAVNLSYPHTFNKHYSENYKNRSLPVLVNDGPINDNKCGFCSYSNHSLLECRKFKKALRKDRWTYVKRNGLCYKCLTSRHKQDACSSPTCDVDECGMAHHRLLHYTVTKNSGQCNITEITDSESNTGPRVETVAHVNTNSCKVFLKTVPIYLHGPNGIIQSYALLDDGSSVTLISDALAARVGTRGSKQTMRVCGAWDNSELVCKTEIINLTMSNTAGTKFNISARSVKNLNLPVQNTYLMELRNYELMKPEIKSCINNGQCKPELLIGQDNYDLLLPLEIMKGDTTEPYFTRTVLGWCMHGCVRMKTSNTETKSTLLLSAKDERIEHEQILRDMHEEMRQSFQLESVGVSSKPRLNKDDVRACEHLERSAKLVNGRWYVGLPWKSDHCEMPNSYPNAMARLKGVERKMKTNQGYAERYKDRVDHLLTNDYASELVNVQNPRNIWYLPHFGVDNPNKQKLRLVFDAASKSEGKCLNDYMLRGPDLLVSLYGIMMRFREHKTAVTADIRDMFLRIKIVKEDRDALRFLWKSSPENPMKTYAMSSLIFGANCSPFIAQFIKNKNAERYESSMPAAAQAICKQHYMDDYIDSIPDDQTAIKLVNDVTYIHKQGGFEIRNWTSNNEFLLNNLSDHNLLPTAVTFKHGQEYAGERTLGLLWYPSDDTLGFDVSFKRIPVSIITGKKKPTKREMLRVMMSIFDIYGFLSPITIKAKIMLQDTWRSGISWDDEIDDVTFIKWSEWLTVMQQVHTIRLPRYYASAAKRSFILDKESICARRTHNIFSGEDAPNNEPRAPAPPLLPLSPPMNEDSSYMNLQLHIFCDASTKAMCATAYWRWIDNKQIRVAFIASKCRVLPVKYVSIPRAELMAALIAARLAKTINSEHRIQAHKKYFWCDSSTVLHWIRNDARNYKAFVAHRLGEIDELTDICEWRYIPTKLNVADIATRDTCEIETLQKEWLYGPSFLYEEEHLWPRKSETQLLDVSDGDLEYVNTMSTYIATVGLPAVPEPERFSSWLRLVKTTSIVLMFLAKCRKLTYEVSAMMARAEVLLLKYSQKKSFPDDLHNLQHNKALEKKSKLLTLTPILDENGVLRLGGRIDSASDVTLGVKQPVILDGRCHVTHLIVKYYHVKACHGNQELVVNELKQRYWILRLRPTVKYISGKCMLCRIRRARPQPPRMGDLPEARVAHHQRPFTHTGLDLFGPLEVTVGRRREKRYGVIFTCLTVRAIHIELVNNLTTDALIMALRRMSARRGWPKFIYSDNGTNLRGADTELRKCVQELDKNKLEVDVTTYSSATRWTFIPPASPHHGGAWERLIRNVKTALKVVLKEQAPREETLTTLLAEIENMVNSRPLTHVSVEPNSHETLTPNHFLLGTSVNTPALGMFNDTDTYLRRQWRISQRMADMFWKRWVREILPEMRPRQKWTSEHRSLQVGDLVLLVDPSSPRNVWPKGLIQTILPGKDGRVRVVDIKTKSGVLRRPATRVALIPIDGECCASTGEGDVGDAHC